MALVLPSELPENFCGVVTFESGVNFPSYSTFDSTDRDRWFYFSRRTGELFRGNSRGYTRIAIAIPAPEITVPAQSISAAQPPVMQPNANGDIMPVNPRNITVTASGGLHMTNSWGHAGSWGIASNRQLDAAITQLGDRSSPRPQPLPPDPPTAAPVDPFATGRRKLLPLELPKAQET
jgi:hypothetical protein